MDGSGEEVPGETGGTTAGEVSASERVVVDASECERVPAVSVERVRGRFGDTHSSDSSSCDETITSQRSVLSGVEVSSSSSESSIPLRGRPTKVVGNLRGGGRGRPRTALPKLGGGRNGRPRKFLDVSGNQGSIAGTNREAVASNNGFCVGGGSVAGSSGLSGLRNAGTSSGDVSDDRRAGGCGAVCGGREGSCGHGGSSRGSGNRSRGRGAGSCRCGTATVGGEQDGGCGGGSREGGAGSLGREAGTSGGGAGSDGRGAGSRGAGNASRGGNAGGSEEPGGREGCGGRGARGRGAGSRGRPNASRGGSTGAGEEPGGREGSAVGGRGSEGSGGRGGRSRGRGTRGRGRGARSRGRGARSRGRGAGSRGRGSASRGGNTGGGEERDGREGSGVGGSGREGSGGRGATSRGRGARSRGRGAGSRGRGAGSRGRGSASRGGNTGVGEERGGPEGSDAEGRGREGTGGRGASCRGRNARGRRGGEGGGGRGGRGTTGSRGGARGSGRSRGRGNGARGARGGTRGSSRGGGAGTSSGETRYAPGTLGSFLQCVTRSYRHRVTERGYYSIPFDDDDANIDKVVENTVGRMAMVCDYCDAKFFVKEAPRGREYKKCCFKGRVMVPPGRPYPPELKHLFLGDDDECKEFRANVRLYNNGCAFAAFTHNSVHLRGRGPKTYSVHGRSYHRIGSLNAGSGKVPRYNQLFTLDSGIATRARVDLPYHQACEASVFELVDRVIRRENPFYQAFLNMQEVQKSTVAAGSGSSSGGSQGSGTKFTMFIGNNKRHDIKRYTAPTTKDEISILIPGDTDEGKPDRYVAVYWKDRPLQLIHFANPCLDPLVYPLLFIYGQLGYSISLFSYAENTNAPPELRPTGEQEMDALNANRSNIERVNANRINNNEGSVNADGDVNMEERFSDASQAVSSVMSGTEDEGLFPRPTSVCGRRRRRNDQGIFPGGCSKRRRMNNCSGSDYDSVSDGLESSPRPSTSTGFRGAHTSRNNECPINESPARDCESNDINATPVPGASNSPVEDAELELDEDEELVVPEDNGCQKVTQMKFYSHMVHVREGNERDNFSPLFHSGKLFQQYICDSFVKVMDERLSFIRRQQGTLRAASYTQVAEQLQNRAAARNLPVGKMVILPSTYSTSERNMRQHYRDAMYIVTKYGKPDYFITFTCNPKWKEITDNLFEGQSAVDRPDLVARVFKLKVEEFVKELKEKKVLGKIVAYTYAIEHQKRGLPHLHLLVIVEQEAKPNTAEKVDAVVSAEIPDPVLHPILHDRVLTHMLHGPCGSLNVHSPCMIDKSCVKKFPKDFVAETVVDSTTFPTYRRTDNSQFPATVKRNEVTNRWIVPYNPYLLLRFNAHINVEVCSSLNSVKYIYKYVHKGHDKVSAVCVETGVFVDENAATSSNNAAPTTVDHDEIQDHIDGRYVCAPEAIGRLLAFPVTHSSHAVYRLPVHLPMEHFVLFTEGLEREAIERELNKRTELLGWFELNKTDEFARTLRYSQLAEHYTWHKKDKRNPRLNFTWTRRVRSSKVIARMHGVSADNMELFSLRLLLLHKTGCTSYDDVKKCPAGVVCNTFKEAAVKHGLLDDDSCWDDTMEEAIAFEMPRQLRQLFVALVVHGEVTDPVRLWEKYKSDLIEDYTWLNDEENATNMALKDIAELMRINGKLITQYGLPEPGELTDAMYLDRDVNPHHELENALNRIPMLNAEQRKAVQEIMYAVQSSFPSVTIPDELAYNVDAGEGPCNGSSSRQKLFYIDGAGGTGKTFVYNTVMSIVKAQRYTALAVAPTGIAACLLPCGWTAHSRFGIPLDLAENSTSNVEPGSNKAAEIRAAKIIVWDEISMTHKYQLNVVDRLLQDLMQNKEPFGGKIVVLGGDFRQQLPIVRGGGRSDVVSACAASGSQWGYFKKLRLTENMRTSPEHREFAEWLIRLGDGSIPPVDPDFPDDIRIPEEFILKKTAGCQSMVDAIFGTSLKASDSAVYANKAILCPLNEDCFRINEEVVRRLEGESIIYRSMDVAKPLSGDPFDPCDISTELLNAQTPSGLPPHRLELKVGAIIMLLRNLNPKVGLVNGARMVVTDLRPGAKVLKAKLMTGKFAGEYVLIPRIKLCPTDGGSNLPVKLERTQFPVRLAFAMTISKSQGQTLEWVGIILSKPVFAHGQLYTAFSRVISKLKVKVQIGPELLEDPCTVTSNIVYKEVFRLRDY